MTSLGLTDAFGDRAAFELLLGPQQRKLELGDVDHLHLMRLLHRSLYVGLGESVAEVAARGIRVTVYDHDPFGHCLFFS
jgi:hypothetical protein